MRSVTYLVFVSGVALLLVLHQGPATTTWIAVACCALLAAIPWYFGTRDRAKAPTATERVAATMWVWLRRFVGVSAGLLMIAAGVHSALAGEPGRNFRDWLGTAFVIVMGLFCLYVGIIGQGAKQFQWQDDLRLHKQNKQRFRWWF